MAQVCFVIFAMLASSASAWSFDQSSRDFSFYFAVNGYEQDSWFGEPSALALDDRSSLMYIADAKAGSVNAFSLQGIPKFDYGKKHDLQSPVGLAIARNGDVFVAEEEGGPVKIIDSRGEVTTLELPTEEDDNAPKPGRMAFDQDGGLYVIDRANCRIYVFDKERNLKFRIGEIGDKQGQFKMLCDVAVDRQGRIYALDSVGVPVQVFDRKGKYIYRFGPQGEGDQDLSFPSGIFIDRHDQIWVVDRGQHALKVFDRSGMFLRKFGDYGLGEGTLFHPIDAGMDNFGRVYVLEAGARRLQVFSLSRPYEPLNPTGL